MSFKNKLILGLIALAKPRRKEPRKGGRRFLVVSTTGLGDTLWGTPALKALRQTYASAYIGVLTTGLGQEVLKNSPHVDEIFCWKKPYFFSFFRLLFALKRRKIETVLIFHTSQRALLPLCSVIGACQIIGSKGINKGLDSLLTRCLEIKPIHEIARRLEIVAEIGAKTQDPTLELFTDEEAEREAAEFLRKCQIPPYISLVGIHPGAKDKFKQWSPDCFIELGKRLSHHLGCQVVVTGGTEERELVQRIAAEIPGAIFVAGELPLHTLAALIKKMSLFVANDTGPMHVAFAIGTPTVALFAPTDHRLCGPYFLSRVEIIQKPPTCTPCVRKKCRDPFCLLQISPQEVYDAALRLYYAPK